MLASFSISMLCNNEDLLFSPRSYQNPTVTFVAPTFSQPGTVPDHSVRTALACLCASHDCSVSLPAGCPHACAPSSARKQRHHTSWEVVAPAQVSSLAALWSLEIRLVVRHHVPAKTMTVKISKSMSAASFSLVLKLFRWRSMSSCRCFIFPGYARILLHLVCISISHRLAPAVLSDF